MMRNAFALTAASILGSVAAAAPPCCSKCAPAPVVTGVRYPSAVTYPAAPGHQHHSAAPAEQTRPATYAVNLRFSAADEKPAGTGADAKEVTLTGTLVCGKCKLKEAKKCTNVLQVKEGGKVVNYSLDDKGNGEAYHDGICGDGEKPGVTVTGTVSERDGKKWVKATKVEEKK